MKKKNTAFKISCRSNNDRRQNNYQIERLNDALFFTPITRLDLGKLIQLFSVHLIHRYIEVKDAVGVCSKTKSLKAIYMNLLFKTYQ